MAADGSVVIDTLIDTKGFGRGMTNMKSQFSSLSKVVRRVGVTIGAAFSIKKAIDLGSDLQEVQNVVDVTFTTMSEKVNEFAQAAATTAGLSETMAKKYVGTFGAMSKSFGFAEKDALEMSTTLTQLTGDVASFYNLTQDEAYTKLKSVFTGETESLKDLGVVMTQTALDSFAMAKGYGKTTSAMTEQEKVALRYQFVMEQLSGAQGDFLRTSDGWANQVRVLKLNVESFMATVGQGLINLLTPVLKAVNRVMSTLQSVGNQFLKWTETITGKKNSVSSGMSSTANSAEQVAGSMEETAAASKKVQNNLSGLDEISIWSSGEDASSDALDSVVSALGSVSTEDIFKSDEITDTIEDAVLDISPAKVGEWLSDALVYAFNGIGKLVDIIDWGGIGSWIGRLLTNIKWGDIILSVVETSASVLRGLGMAIGEGIYAIFEEGSSVNDWLLSLQENPVTGESSPWDPGTLLFNLFEDAVDAAESVFVGVLAGISGAEYDEAKLMKDAYDEVFSKHFKENPVTAILNALHGYYDEEVAEKYNEKKTAAQVNSLLERAKEILEVSERELGDNRLDALYRIVQEIRGYEGYEWVELKDLLNMFGTTVDEVLGKTEDSFNKTAEEILRDLGVISDVTLEELAGLPALASDKGSETGMAYIDSLSSSIGSGTDILAQGVQSDIGGALDAKDAAEEAGTTVGEAYSNAVSSGATSSVDAWMNAISALLSPAMKTVLDNAKEVVNQDIKNINDWIDDVTSETGDKRVPPPEKLGYAGAVKAGVLKLPYLAKGTVIPPNAPFAAILGDQKRGTNIEAPLDTIKQALREVMGEGGSGGGNSYNITAMAKGKTIFELVLSEGKMKQAQTGKNPFLLT